jgi:hypothetical protein
MRSIEELKTLLNAILTSFGGSCTGDELQKEFVAYGVKFYEVCKFLCSGVSLQDFLIRMSDICWCYPDGKGDLIIIKKFSEETEHMDRLIKSRKHLRIKFNDQKIRGNIK